MKVEICFLYKGVSYSREPAVLPLELWQVFHPSEHHRRVEKKVSICFSSILESDEISL